MESTYCKRSHNKIYQLPRALARGPKYKMIRALAFVPLLLLYEQPGLKPPFFIAIKPRAKARGN
jgi:hypothetical protein